MLQRTASNTATTLRLRAVHHVAGHSKSPYASHVACITHCTAKILILAKCVAASYHGLPVHATYRPRLKMQAWCAP